MRRPNFFIAGAPKCGTTALYHCLRGHPDIFMPHSEDPELYWLCKEPNHFCSDLGIATWLRAETEEDYLALFEGARDERCIGSASPFNLLSPEAAGRIHEFTGGEAKIIIMLRSPVGWMRSFHHDMLRHGYENIGSFRKALEAEEARSRGERLPKRDAFAGCLGYRYGANFAEQIQRYFDLFPRQNILIGLLDDMKADALAFVAKVLEFLEVDTAFVPEMKRKNDSSTLPGTHLFDLTVGRVVSRLPAGSLAKRVFRAAPEKLYRAIADKLLPPLSDKSIEPELAAELAQEFRQPIAELGDLIGRDLLW